MDPQHSPPIEGELDPAAEEELRALARLLGGGSSPRSDGTQEPNGTGSPNSASPKNGGQTSRGLGERKPAGEPRFTLLRRLGSSPFGDVFRARDVPHHGREVHLVRLHPEKSERPGLKRCLTDLGECLGGLDSEGLARWQGVFESGDGHFEVAWEAIEGENLREEIDRRGTLPPRQALEIARQTLMVLERAHRHGVVHGRLCAETLVLGVRVPWSADNPFGVQVRVTEFGLAAILETKGSSAPQDLEAVGALLTEMVTGTRLPPGGADWPALRSALPKDLAQLVERSLGIGPCFTSASEFRVALERTPSWVGSPARRGRWAAFAFALALAFLLLFVRERRQRVRVEENLAAARDGSALPAASAALDRFLERLEEGDHGGAAEVAAAARALPDLARLGFGDGYLESLLSMREALDVAARMPDPLVRARALLETRAILTRAGGERERFLLSGARWLALGLPPRPGRSQDCERWHTGLEREWAQLSAALTQPLEARWQALADGAEGEPGEVLLLARWFADERVEAYARGLPPSDLRAELLTLVVR